MVLPAELIDHIFSFLRGNISALKACSKAHPLYSRLAERHLYAHIIVTEANSSEVHKQFSKNSRILDYPCTLGLFNAVPEVLPIMPMIPRMANLTSLSLFDPLDGVDSYNADFLSSLRNCLRQSALEELCLYRFYNFPLSVLDHGKNIKKLILSDCTAMQEPISGSESSFPHQSLETLIICGDYNPGILVWTMHRATHLTSLKLQCEKDGRDWIAIPEILSVFTTYSKCLTRLHLDVRDYCRSIYYCPTGYDIRGGWTNLHVILPFTLSALMCLLELSIFAICSSSGKRTRLHCALPAIMRLVKTAPSIRVLVLSFCCDVSDVTVLGRLDWSSLNLLQTDSGIRPRIDLRIGTKGMDHSFSSESILDALAGNEVLMDLVKRDVVILKPERDDEVQWGGEGEWADPLFPILDDDVYSLFTV